MEGLAGQFLLERDPLGHVPGVEYDAAHPAVGSHVRDPRLQVPPLAEAIADPEHELAGIALGACVTHDPRVVVRDEPEEPFAEEPSGLAAEHLTHRVARVAAPTPAEDQHEVGGGGDQAPETGCLPPRDAHQGDRESERDEQPGAAEEHLRADQIVDAVICRSRDAPRRIQGHVRGQGGEHSQALNRMLRELVLAGARRQAPRRVSRKHRVAGPRQVIDQPPLLNQLLSDGASLGGAELALVVVPGDGRSDAAAEKGIGAFCEQLARTHWVRVASLGGEQDSGDIALRQGLLPRRDLHDRRLVLGTLGRPDREDDRDDRDDRDRGEDRTDRQPSAGLEGAEGASPWHR